MQYTVFLILAPLSILILLSVVISTRRYGGAPEIVALRWLAAGVIGWLFFDSLEVLAPTPELTLFWARVSYLFIAGTPVCWLAFAMQYSFAGTRIWLRTAGFWLFLLIPSLTVFLLWVPQLTHLVWSEMTYVPVEGLLVLQLEHGTLFWVNIIHAYALIMLGALFIVRHAFGLSLYRTQSRWMLIGALLPLSVNLVYVFRLIPDLRKDYTPIGFAMGGIAFSIAMLWHRLFDLKPIARATLIDQLVDPMMTVDLEDRLIDFNPAAGELLTSLDPERSLDDLIGVPFSDSLQGWPALVHHLGSAPPENGDLTLDRDGVTRFYECRVAELHSIRNRPMGRLIVLHDITQSKETESALRYHMAELEVSNEHLDAFAHTVAHDLKAPLATIMGYAEMLNFYHDQLTPEQVQQHLVDLEQTGEHMVRIIDALLLFSRVHRQSDLALDCVDMGDIVAESLDRAATSMMRQNARIVTPVSWPSALGYGPWIVEVWVNYLTNALKYGSDPPVLELGYSMKPDGEGRDAFVCFWVRDQGQGLTESQIEKLFVPFSRLHSSEVQGHGLGLSIVRRIVERLGGQVGVESVLGKGSTFWFTLPTVDAALELEEINQQGAMDAVGEPDFA
jgi:PAS domain S-box-containing protein